ncbi:hypothetical protein GW17_00018239 [Ensete ventricosum]|nr:hypothetical protein GW17_00018239 [Ensete ventricosum]
MPAAPRISFSGDFAVEPPATRTPGPPPDPNFEFAVGSHSMIDADQLFFKGRLLPLKDSHQGGPQRITTLREELGANNEDGVQLERPPRGTIKWKELLGLKKSHCSSAGAAASEVVVKKSHKKNEDELPVKPTQLGNQLWNVESDFRSIQMRRRLPQWLFIPLLSCLVPLGWGTVALLSLSSSCDKENRDKD